MQRFLFVVFTLIFITTVTALPISKGKSTSKHTKVFSVKSKDDAFKLLTEMGYNPCENISDSKTNKHDRPLCQTGIETLLEAFQRAFRLPITRQLDKATLKLMNTPRCGTIDGPAELADRSRLWPTDRALKWKLNYNSIPYDKINARRMIQEGFDDWSRYTDLTFREAIGNEQADFQLSFVSGEHGDGFPIAPERRGTLAHAFLPWSGNRGQLHFDAVESWSQKYEYHDTEVNMRLVATHEIGHLLGLEHSTSTDALMYKWYQLMQPKDILPTVDQVNIQSLYGPKSRTFNTVQTSATRATKRMITKGTKMPTMTTLKDCSLHGQYPWFKYEGKCNKDGKKHGWGTYTWANGDRYTGDWKNDKRNGDGLSLLASGNEHRGQYREDAYYGKGTYSWKNGDKYEGQFEDGYFHGKGTFTRANGDKYEGDWVIDQMNGQGIKTWSNGDKFEGTFEKGVPTDGHMTAGPLSNNNHAIQRCPVVCEKIKLKWNGHWFTTIKDVMSVCRCVT